MDDTELSPSQREIRDLAQNFASKEISPHTSVCDENQSLPKGLLAAAQAAGLMNTTIPEKWGGLGLNYEDYVLITEELAYGCVAMAGAISLNSMMADAILLGGSDSQKKTYLSRLLKGEMAAYCMTEPNAGSDVAGIQSSATKTGTKYLLNGSKTWISNADLAHFFIVFAKTDKTSGNRGISCFLVDRDTPGLKVGAKIPKMGQRAASANEVFLESVEVPEGALLGREGDGFLLAMKVFDHSRPMVAALATGLTRRALFESINYSNSRQSQGKPLSHHQLVAQKLAEMGMRYECAHLLTRKSARLLDQKKRNTLLAAYAKTYASDAAVFAASEAVQIFGGMGYSPEYPVEKLYRDAKVLQIYEGTNEIQRLIIARELTTP